MDELVPKGNINTQTSLERIFKMNMRRQRQPTTNCSVFFTGIFGSGPAAEKDFRYGEVDYADEKTAQEAIQRLNGHNFGDRPMRVTMVDTRFRKRGRREQPHPAPPTTDDRGRPLMQFSRGFFDPVLGREDSMVLNVLKGIAVDDAYEAAEQLRVLVMTRPEDAKNLMRENPALVSALIMILQHAKRVHFGPLPSEAFESATAIGAGGEAGGGKDEASAGASPQQTQAGAPRSNPPPVEREKESAQQGTSGGEAGDSPLTITDAQRQQTIAIIKGMKDLDKERIRKLTADDMAKVPDPGKRRQLQVIHQCLIEMDG
eukprot:gene1594-971_t